MGRACGNTPHPSPLPKGKVACSRLHGSFRLAWFGSPSCSLRRALLSRPRGRMPSERRWAMGKIGKGRAQLDPIWRENTDVRSGLWPEPWMAKDKGPSARAVGQEGELKVPDVSRANKRGRRPLVLFAKESGSFQSHSPRPEGRAKPRRGQRPRVPCGEAASRGQPLARESGESLSSWSGLFPAVQCAALIAPYGATTSTPRTSEYAALFEPTGPITSLTFEEP
ncbi:hypothetical protein D3C77_160630 [compost metagenome]